MPKKYIKQWADNGDEEIITEKQLREELTNYYKDIDLAIEALNESSTLRTNFAFYKLKN